MITSLVHRLFMVFFIVAPSLLISENLLTQDSFYEKVLPELLGEDFRASGTYRTAYFAHPSHFHPFSNDPFISSLWNLCTGSLSQLKLGCYQTMAPALASKIEKVETPNGVDYLVELKQDLYWMPLDANLLGEKKLNPHFLKRTQVKSQDFQLYLDLIQNPYNPLPLAVSQRSLYEDVESIEVLDDSHFIVHWRGKGHFDRDDLTGQLRPIPAHVYLYGTDGEPLIEPSQIKNHKRALASYFVHHWAQKTIVSCGPWKMGALRPDSIELLRNEGFPNPHQALFERMLFIQKASPNSAWQAFKSHELDTVYLTPLQWKNYQSFLKTPLYQKQRERGLKIESLTFSTPLYYFIGWNQKKALFREKNIRKALSYAVDTEKIIEHFLKGFAKPLTGPYLPGSPSYNRLLLPIKADVQYASSLLDQLGWRSKEVLGIRTHEKTGEPLSFKLTYFLRNEQAQSICQFISTSLREIGIHCVLDGADYVEFMERYQKKDFDAIYMAWALAPPPEDLSATWSSTEADCEGSNNLVGFKNQEVDSLLKKLKECANPDKRAEYSHLIHQIIYEEQPYTFLFVPEQIFLYRTTLENVFVPKSRQDLIQGADIEEPCLRAFYFKRDL